MTGNVELPEGVEMVMPVITLPWILNFKIHCHGTDKDLRSVRVVKQLSW